MCVGIKKDIMKSLHKLKTNNPGVYINHDRSKEERDHFNEIRTKQKQMIANDTSGEWFFKIKGPPWNLSIMQEKKRMVNPARNGLESVNQSSPE